MLHDGVVDGDFRECRKTLRQVSGVIALGEFRDEFLEVWLMLAALGEECLCLPEEHACVPAMTLPLEEGDGLGLVGLFHKAVHGDHARLGSGSLLELQVAEAGGGEGRGDRKCQDRIVGSHVVGCFGKLDLEGGRVMDHGIRREECRDGIGTDRPCDGRGQGSGGSRVALRRLGDDIGHREERNGGLCRLQLRGVRQDEDPLVRNEALESPDGLLEQGLLSEEFHQMLWSRGAADGPEALAAAAGHDENDELVDGRGHAPLNIKPPRAWKDEVTAVSSLIGLQGEGDG